MSRKKFTKKEPSKQEVKIFQESEDSFRQLLNQDKEIYFAKPQSSDLIKYAEEQINFEDQYNFNEHSEFNFHQLASLDLDICYLNKGLFDSYSSENSTRKPKQSKKGKRGRKKKNNWSTPSKSLYHSEIAAQQNKDRRWKFSIKIEDLFSYKLNNKQLFQRIQ